LTHFSWAKTYTLCLRKNAPTLASCSFVKHRLILIIFSQQHQHTFKNDTHVQLFFILSPLYLLYLLLNSCDGNDAKQRIFLGRLLVAVKRAGFAGWLDLKTAGFSLADVQSDVLLPLCLHVTAFSIDQLLCRWRFFDMLAHVSMRRCFKSLVTAAGVADRYLYSVHTFLHKSTNSVVNRWWTQSWRDKIRCFLLKELDFFTSIE